MKNTCYLYSSNYMSIKNLLNLCASELPMAFRHHAYTISYLMESPHTNVKTYIVLCLICNKIVIKNEYKSQEAACQLQNYETLYLSSNKYDLYLIITVVRILNEILLVKIQISPEISIWASADMLVTLSKSFPGIPCSTKCHH